MVISWIFNLMSDLIKKLIFYIDSVYEIWKQLEKRFFMSNGSRKYKLSKDLYGLK